MDKIIKKYNVKVCFYDVFRCILLLYICVSLVSLNDCLFYSTISHNIMTTSLSLR